MNLISKAKLALKSSEVFSEERISGKIVRVSSHELARGILVLSEIVKDDSLSGRESTIVSLYKMSDPGVDDHKLELAVKKIPNLFGTTIGFVAERNGIANAFAAIQSSLRAVDDELLEFNQRTLSSSSDISSSVSYSSRSSGGSS